MLRAVHQSVESVGCRLEVSRQERSSIVACLAAVTSDKLFHSLAEPDSILQASGLKGSAPDSAIRALSIWPSLRAGCMASPRSRPVSTRWGALVRGQVLCLGDEETVPGCRYCGQLRLWKRNYLATEEIEKREKGVLKSCFSPRPIDSSRYGLEALIIAIP